MAHSKKAGIAVLTLCCLLFNLTPTQNCPSFYETQWRYWLLDPGTVALRSLLPYTYAPEDIYYPGDRYLYSDTDGNAPAKPDPAHYAPNVLEWRTALRNAATAADIRAILYDTPPEDYFAKKYGKNTMMTALKSPENAILGRYLNFAKRCEAQLNPGGEWANAYESDSTQIAPLLKEADGLLSGTQNAFVQQRAAYLRIKLAGYYGERGVSSADLYQKYLLPAKGTTWVSDAAVFHVANSQTDGIKANLWYARAWNCDDEHRQRCEMLFTCKNADATFAIAQTPDEKAAVLAICAMIWPGPALDRMEQLYAVQPAHKDLSMLMAREVNKLEDWLMTAKVSIFESSHAEIPYDSVYDKNAQLSHDLAHLHACRAFVKKVTAANKRPDPAFWHLSAAHLAFLDQDFAQAQTSAQAGLSIVPLPPQQRLQLQLIQVLAEAAAAPAVSDALETKIIAVLDQISKNKAQLADHGGLYSQVIRLLSDLLIQKGAIAKGALLLNQTELLWDTYGVYCSKDGYDKLLDIGQPADFDAAVALINNPRTPLERWLTQHPSAYHAGLQWNEKMGEVTPWDENAVRKWDISQVYNLKSMYYLRRDQLDSALVALKNVQSSTLKGAVSAYGDSYNYFYRNPFSIGISLPNVPLSESEINPFFDKKTFIEQIIALQKEAEANPDKRQLNYFLLGNAYFNMSYPGRNWFLMLRPYKGSFESAMDLKGNWQVHEKEMARWSSINTPADPENPRWGGVVWLFPMLGLALWPLFRRHTSKKQWLLAAPVFAILLMASTCNRAIKTTAPAAPLRPTDDAEKVWFEASRAVYYYEKALNINPKSDLGVICVHQLGSIKNSADQYKFERQERYWEKEFKPAPNPYLNRIEGYQYQAPVSCMMLQDFLNNR